MKNIIAQSRPSVQLYKPYEQNRSKRGFQFNPRALETSILNFLYLLWPCSPILIFKSSLGCRAINWLKAARSPFETIVKRVPRNMTATVVPIPEFLGDLSHILRGREAACCGSMPNKLSQQKIVEFARNLVSTKTKEHLHKSAAAGDSAEPCRGFFQVQVVASHESRLGLCVINMIPAFFGN
jgi:hypothetical protein